MYNIIIYNNKGGTPFEHPGITRPYLKGKTYSWVAEEDLKIYFPDFEDQSIYPKMLDVKPAMLANKVESTRIVVNENVNFRELIQQNKKIHIKPYNCESFFYNNKNVPIYIYKDTLSPPDTHILSVGDRKDRLTEKKIKFLEINFHLKRMAFFLDPTIDFIKQKLKEFWGDSYIELEDSELIKEYHSLQGQI